MKVKRYFTLVELMVAMTVFSMVMLMVFMLFSSSMMVWRKSSQQNQIFENARMAMDLMSRDLQCAYYEAGKTPFWFKPATTYVAPDKQYNNPSLCFMATTLVPPNPYCQSKTCEIKYQLYGMTFGTKNANDGWLLRSATGDSKSDGTDNLYNASTNPTGTLRYYNFYTVRVRGGAPSTQVFTLDIGSSDAWENVIPYVTSLTFECNKRDGSVITGYSPATATTSIAPTAAASPFPFSVKINLTLLDMDSWNIWMAKIGSSASEPAAAATFRKQRERQFSRMILIGERGQ